MLNTAPRQSSSSKRRGMRLAGLHMLAGHGDSSSLRLAAAVLRGLPAIARTIFLRRHKCSGSAPRARAAVS